MRFFVYPIILLNLFPLILPIETRGQSISDDDDRYKIVFHFDIISEHREAKRYRREECRYQIFIDLAYGSKLKAGKDMAKCEEKFGASVISETELRAAQSSHNKARIKVNQARSKMNEIFNRRVIRRLVDLGLLLGTVPYQRIKYRDIKGDFTITELTCGRRVDIKKIVNQASCDQLLLAIKRLNDFSSPFISYNEKLDRDIEVEISEEIYQAVRDKKCINREAFVSGS